MFFTYCSYKFDWLKYKTMPKLTEYPRASFKNALSLANAVNALGGDCSVNTCADKLNYKGGNKNGAFNSLVGAAVKHGLITSKSETLIITDIYSKISLSYNDKERQEHLQSAFLTPMLYRKIYEKFRGKELPLDILERMLIREYNVDQSVASRVTGYIIEGAKFVSLLVENKLIENLKVEEVEVFTGNRNLDGHKDERREKAELIPYQEIPIHRSQNEGGFNSDGYVLHIIGPDIDSKYKLADEDDFAIIEATLRKLKRKLGVT